MELRKEQVVPANISEVMKNAYMDYSVSVIVGRALPDVRDGLKPSQRRIFYAMLREGLLHNRPYDKCAGVVGEVLKNYHPHGDTSVYDTLVRLAQSWVMRYALVDPQGNFGSMDGDSAAAYRYTECRLTKASEALLQNLDEDTVDFVPNYKESTTEPSVLPAALPNLLMNGSTGIAVGMTTNIPPHNLGELIDAICALIDDPQLSIERIMGLLPGPDFPTGGSIIGLSGIRSYMQTGRGILRVRGTIELEEHKGGKEQLVITEIPYNLNRSLLVTRIAELIADKTLEEIADLRDESDQKTRIVIELKRNGVPRVLMNKLFQLTPLESSFGVILLALDKRRPKQMNIKEMIQCYIEHRREVIYRRTQFQLNKALERLHILEAYRIALDNLDDFVRIIRGSQDKEQARQILIERYELTIVQANAILEMRLYQLTGLEREKIEAEYNQLKEWVAELESILASESKLLGIIKTELQQLRALFADPRRTKLLPSEGEFRMEDVIPNEGCIITVSHKGFIKRTGLSAYRSQKRGGKGVLGSGAHDDDFVEHLFTANAHDYIMFIMNNGRIYVEKVYEIPEGSRTSKGRSIVNVLEMQKDEVLAAMICLKNFDPKYSLVLCTRHGVIKKTNLGEYQNYRKGGIIGIKIDPEDQVISGKLTSGDDQIVLITYHAMSIRFSEEDLRDQGRATRGVKGIQLREEDYVKAMEIVDPEASLLIAGENGIGKRSSFEDYRMQSRGGMGVIAIRTESNVAGALSVSDSDEIMLLTQSGQAIRAPVADIRVIGRTTQGVRLINLAKGDTLVGVCRVVEGEEKGEDGPSLAAIDGTESGSQEPHTPSGLDLETGLPGM